MALITATELAAALDVEQGIADRLLPVATALVNQYAPGADDAIRSEAIVRCSGWMKDQPKAAIRDEETGDIKTSYAANNTNALKHSGAMSLLAPFRVWRAGVIG